MGPDSGKGKGRSGSRARKDKAKSYGYSYLVRSTPPASVHDLIVQWLLDQGSEVQRHEADRIIVVHHDPWARGLGRWSSSKLISISLQEINEGTRVRAIIRTSRKRRTDNREERRDYDEWLTYGILMESMMSYVDRGSHKPDHGFLNMAEEQERADISDGRAIMAACGFFLMLSSFLAYQAVVVMPLHRSTQASLIALISELVIITAIGFFFWGWTFYADGKRIRKYIAENAHATDQFAPL